MTNIDEDFLKEMLEYVKDYHTENGCDEKLANLLGLFDTYKLRAIHQKGDLKTCFQIRHELRETMQKFKNSKWELLGALFHSIEILIANQEEKRTKEDPSIYLNIYTEDGETVFHLVID